MDPHSLPAVDANTGLLAPALQIPSPNFDERPVGSLPELIVVHCISLPPGRYGTDAIVAFFQNRLDPNAHTYFTEIADLKVSAHVLIERTGNVLQFVSFNKRAWHAGESEYCGRRKCNDFSIGIELEGTDDSPFADSQYVALRGVIKSLLAAYPSLSSDRIVGHSDIAPGRKRDPGSGFNWHELDALKT